MEHFHVLVLLRGVLLFIQLPSYFAASLPNAARILINRSIHSSVDCSFAGA